MPVKRGTGLDDNCCNSITYISIQSSVFPRMWKHAKVFPLHKKKSQDDVNNFYSSKCFLNIRNVSFHLYGYLSSHNLLNKRQSGFRANHSCESALTLMNEEWLSALFTRNQVGLLLVDLCKAFDLVNHVILLESF